jgi:hypothetical protein
MSRQTILTEYHIIDCQDKKEITRISHEDKSYQSKLEEHGIPADRMDLHNRPRFKNEMKRTHQEKLI